MSLPASQQRALDEIEDDLHGCEPRLVSMFAIFTRLTRDEGSPPAERLRSGGRRRRAWPGRELAAGVGAMIILGLVALFMFMAVSSAGHACTLGAAPYSAVTSRALGCQSAPEPEPPGHGS